MSSPPYLATGSGLRWLVGLGSERARLGWLASLPIILTCAVNSHATWRPYVVPSNTLLTFSFWLPADWTVAYDGNATTASSADGLTVTFTDEPNPTENIDLDACVATLLQQYDSAGSTPTRDSLITANLRYVALETHVHRPDDGKDAIARVACYETSTTVAYPLIKARAMGDASNFTLHRSEILHVLGSVRFRPAA